MSGGDWKELFQAACDGDLPLLRYHAERGVDVNFAHPEFLSTPLVACILAGQEPAARLLLAQGADPCLGSELDGLTPWQAAHRIGMDALAQDLQALGAEPRPPMAAAPSDSPWWAWRKWFQHRAA
jgi:ankyrin repeat protein